MLEVICLATIVFNEARGTTNLAQIAVAHVVLKTYPDPCNIPNAEFVNKTPVNAKALDPIERAAWLAALDVSYKVLNGLEADPVPDATHFSTERVIPYWAKSGMGVTPIGKLWFWSKGIEE